jgi:uncharacterized alpha-E superfamily protein
MLSRIAESVYWAARYFERAENTARIVLMHHSLLLDVPCDTNYCWEPLMAITGSAEQFYQKHNKVSEQEVTDFLVLDKKNFSSVNMSLAMARENLRTARAEFPRDAWECVNQLYWYSVDKKHLASRQSCRYDYLRHIINTSQQFKGIISDTMSRDSAYNFMRLGNFIERADMTTRVIDVRAVNLLLSQKQELKPYEDIKWMNILKSLAAYQMYRQTMNSRVSGAAVLSFLLKNNQFPRSVHRCLYEISECLEFLKDPQQAQNKIDELSRLINKADISGLVHQGLHEFMDEIQKQLAEIHKIVSSSYFHVESELVSI